jgi:hypothetical protein
MASLADILDEALGSSDEGDVEKRIEEALACPCVGARARSRRRAAAARALALS